MHVFNCLFCSIFATNFAVCTLGPTVRWSLRYVALGFFFKAIMVTSLKSFAGSPIAHILLTSRLIILRPFFPNSVNISHVAFLTLMPTPCR